MLTEKNLSQYGDEKNASVEIQTELKNVNTKSSVLAPFNTTIPDKEDCNFIEFSLLDKGKIFYSKKVKDANKNYEDNYNGQVDNSVIVTNNSSKNRPI